MILYITHSEKYIDSFIGNTIKRSVKMIMATGENRMGNSHGLSQEKCGKFGR
jgi:hypothetical protein